MPAASQRDKSRTCIASPQPVRLNRNGHRQPHLHLEAGYSLSALTWIGRLDRIKILSYIKAKTNKAKASQNTTEMSTTSTSPMSDGKNGMVRLRVVDLRRNEAGNNTTLEGEWNPDSFEECITLSQDAPLSSVWVKLKGAVVDSR
jgi:hypothetical protein